MISGWGTIFHLVPLTSRDLGGRPKAIGLASTRNTSARLTCRQMELNRAGGACLTVERRSHSIVVKDGRKFGIGLAMLSSKVVFTHTPQPHGGRVSSWNLLSFLAIAFHLAAGPASLHGRRDSCSCGST